VLKHLEYGIFDSLIDKELFKALHNFKLDHIRNSYFSKQRKARNVKVWFTFL